MDFADFDDGQRAELRAADDGEIRGGAVVGSASNPLTGEAEAVFNEVAAEILTAADERGLPLVLPILDAEDRRHVRFADVWGGFDRIVARAAERYNADAMMIVRIMQTELGLEVRWIVQRDDRMETLTTPRARLGIDWLADEFASEFTTIGDANLARLTIREVRTWPDFGRVLDYLESVSVIESVDVESITGTDLVLRVTARGDDSQLIRYLTLDGQLAADERADGLVFVPAWRRGADGQFAP